MKDPKVIKAEQILIDNGIEPDEAETVLQAIGYALLDTELYECDTVSQPERKRGRWIVYYECPKCGEITKDFTEYCPFCNADMRGAE